MTATLANLPIRFYLAILPRPKFEDEDHARISNVCADVNGMTILILLLYLIENSFARISTATAVTVVYVGLAYLVLERVAIFHGWARVTVFTYGLALGAAWLGLTYVGGTVRHTQSMILCIGIAYVSTTLGLRYGMSLVGIYICLLIFGWYLEDYRSAAGVPAQEQLKYVSAAILSMILLATVCEILREHLVEKFRVALAERNGARDSLVAANARLKSLLEATEGELNQAVAVTNSALVKQQQFDHMDVLVSGLSHEMGTPVGNARLAAENMTAWARELMLNPNTDKARASKLLGNMDESARIIGGNLSRADDLLTSFKQLSLDQTGTNMRSFNLAQAIDRALLLLKPELQTVKVKTELDRGLFMFSLPYAIEQLISNFVSNAVRHGLESTGNPQITVRCEKVSGEPFTKITVTDNGCGIAPDVLPLIFNPFYTTRRGRGGSGMGLSVVRYLVETVLGGTVAVQSDKYGTSFVTRLPLTTDGVWNESTPAHLVQTSF